MITSDPRAGQAAPTLFEIEAARRRIDGLARPTPLERSAFLSEHCGHDVYLKLECWQQTRSFKVRGAANAVALLSSSHRARGVVAASAGNHGQAVALAARHAGIRATVFVPADAPATKKERIRRLGATLDDGAASYDDAEIAAREYAAHSGGVLIHAFSDAAVVAGQGTVGLEILEDLADLEDVLVPVGGGGLVAGIGIVLKERSRAIGVIGVQSVETRAMHDALLAGRVVDTAITPTLADGLAGSTDDLAFQRARRVLDGMLLVEESEIADAMRLLFIHEGIVAEGSGAVGVAALLRGHFEPRGPTVVVVTGGNVDAARFAALLART